MRHGKLAVFVGAMFALFFMTAGSAMVGALVASSADLLASSVGGLTTSNRVHFQAASSQLFHYPYYH
jgi:putative Ca2+/H+ antiporter (TMEM165/GDT1 family)